MLAFFVIRDSPVARLRVTLFLCDALARPGFSDSGEEREEIHRSFADFGRVAEVMVVVV